MSDPEWAELLEKSPGEAYKQLIDCYGNYVYAIVRSKLGKVGTREDCEDCVSEQDFALYQPYIDGEMELDEATRRFRASFIREDMDRPPRGVCGFVK